MIGKNTKREHVRRPHDSTLVVGEGSDMQIKPETFEQWQVDACDKDMWKHGRVSNPYRNNYDNINWE